MTIKQTSLFCLSLLIFCASFFLATSGTAQEIQSPLPGVERVVLIGADGFGSFYTHWDQLPHLNKMKENGAWTLHMRSVLPSVSAINWASILMGAPSEMHGYREWGSKTPDLPSIALTDKGKFPCIFSVLRDQVPDAKSAAVYDWDGIGFLYENTAVNEQKFVDNNSNADVTAFALKALEQKPALLFAYYGNTDVVGHGKGWGTPEYQQEMINIDAEVGKILDYLEKNGMLDSTIVVFISDHGGTEKGHGQGIMEHMEVPWIVYGPGVKAGEIKDAVVNYDNTATIAWILGLKAPQVWRGQVIKSAFDVQ